MHALVYILWLGKAGMVVSRTAMWSPPVHSSVHAGRVHEKSKARLTVPLVWAHYRRTVGNLRSGDVEGHLPWYRLFASCLILLVVYFQSGVTMVTVFQISCRSSLACAGLPSGKA